MRTCKTETTDGDPHNLVEGYVMGLLVWQKEDRRDVMDP